MTYTNVAIETCCCDAPNGYDAHGCAKVRREDAESMVTTSGFIKVFSVGRDADDNKYITQDADTYICYCSVDDKGSGMRAKFFIQNISDDDHKITEKSEEKQDDGEPQVDCVVYNGRFFKCVVGHS